MSLLQKRINFVFLLILFFFNIIYSSKSSFARTISKEEIIRQKRVDKILDLIIEGIEEKIFESDTEFYKYRDEYNRFLDEQNIRVSNKKEILSQISEAKFLLVNDRHVAPHDQVGLVEILKHLSKEKAPITLAIEFIDRKYQNYIDLYLDGNINLSALKSKIKYSDFWDFNWNSFKEILLVGKKYRKKGFRIIATESFKDREMDFLSLKQRDGLITSRIIEDYKANPDYKYVVFFGSFHLLGEGHMKDIFEKELNINVKTVLSDYPRGFWDILEKTMDTLNPKAMIFSEDIFYLSSLDPISYKILYLDYMGVSLEEIKIILNKSGLKLKTSWFGLGGLCRNMFKNLSGSVLKLQTSGL